MLVMTFKKKLCFSLYLKSAEEWIVHLKKKRPAGHLLLLPAAWQWGLWQRPRHFSAGITGLHAQLRVKQHTELTVIQRIRQDLLHQQWLESVQRLEIHSMFMFVPGLSGIWGNERPVRLACLAITTGWSYIVNNIKDIGRVVIRGQHELGVKIGISRNFGHTL